MMSPVVISFVLLSLKILLVVFFLFYAIFSLIFLGKVRLLSGIIKMDVNVLVTLVFLLNFLAAAAVLVASLIFL